MPTISRKRWKTKRKFKKKSKILSFLFVILFFLLFFLSIINISDIFSSLIANKSSIFSSTRLEIPSYSIYGVSLEKFEEKSKAEDFSKEVSLEGGAKFVYQKGEYYVLASSYPTLLEAQEIEENLKTLGYDSKVLNIKVDSILKPFEIEFISKFFYAIDSFKQIYLELYDISIDFDKALINKNQLKGKIAQLLTNISEKIRDIEGCDIKDDTNQKQTTLSFLKSEKKMLEEFLYLEGSQNELSSGLKTLALKTVLLNQNFAKVINS